MRCVYRKEWCEPRHQRTTENALGSGMEEELRGIQPADGLEKYIRVMLYGT
jgi:hypothetical protein